MSYNRLSSGRKVVWGCALLSLFLLALCLPAGAASTKGIQVVIKDRQGKDVGLYKGSYALLIEASRYKGGWPSLRSKRWERVGKTGKRPL